MILNQRGVWEAVSLSLVSPIQIEVDGVEGIEDFQNVQTNCWQSFKFTEPLD